jgi:hypothetical protein
MIPRTFFVVDEMRIGNNYGAEEEDYLCGFPGVKFLLCTNQSEPPFGAWSSFKMWTYAVTDSIRRNQSLRSDYCLMFVYTGYITIKPEMHPWFVWLYFGKSVIAGRTAFRGMEPDAAWGPRRPPTGSS